jgi:hypothetical protein
MTEHAYEKKRVGLARKQARNLMERYKKTTGTEIDYEVPITDIAKYLGFHVEYLDSMADHHSAIIYVL